MESAHRAAPLELTRARIPAHRVFYPLAAAYAAFAVPASVLGMLGRVPPVTGLVSPGRHAHEMMFGFALALVAGHQMGALTRGRLILLAACWTLARAAFLAAPTSAVSAVANVAFALWVAIIAGWRLLPAVKKARNLALPVTIVALCASAALAQAATHAGAFAEHIVRGIALLFIAMLLLFMGGRIIAPAIAGQMYRQGGNLEARVQPRIEAGLIVAMSAAFFATLGGGMRAAGIALVAAGILAAVRLARWRPWRLRGRADLLCLCVGYAWLAAGLMALGWAFFAGEYLTAALHIITVGALGTLAVNVMSPSRPRHEKASSALHGGAIVSTAFVGIAAIARVCAAFHPEHAALLLEVAALAWSAAYLVLLGRLLAVTRSA